EPLDHRRDLLRVLARPRPEDPVPFEHLSHALVGNALVAVGERVIADDPRAANRDGPSESLCRLAWDRLCDQKEIGEAQYLNLYFWYLGVHRPPLSRIGGSTPASRRTRRIQWRRKQ